jgi:hypothetical protein
MENVQKLTLSVDARVIARAKRYARARGTSVSRIVETLLGLVASEGGDAAPGPTPVLHRLRGSLRKGAVGDYRRHLERKYRCRVS